VIICAFADERLELTVSAVEAVVQQEPEPLEVFVVVDHNEPLAEHLRTRLPAVVTVIPNEGDPGLSSARNTAIGRATADVIAFLDDDAVPHSGWLARLLAAFGDSTVVGAGGWALPVWEDHQPDWFPAAFLWVVGCSYEGQAETGAVRNPFGSNMAFRRAAFERVGLFDTEIGRLGSVPLGCEETELCIRAAREIPGAQFVMVEGARIDHWVPQVRGEPRYLVRRSYYEGISKALVRTLGDARSLDTERAYVSRALPLEMIRSLRALITGPARSAAAGRIAAVLVGLAAAVVGYAYGYVLFRRTPPAAAQRP
jgi:GT2 family glycosyltransferase